MDAEDKENKKKNDGKSKHRERHESPEAVKGPRSVEENGEMIKGRGLIKVDEKDIYLKVY